MKRIAVAALTILLAGTAFAACPVVPVSCGSRQTGTFSSACTGDFNIGGTTLTYPEVVFTISPPVGQALGADLTTTTSGSPAYGSGIFILDSSNNTLDDSVDSYLVYNELTSAFKISTSGTYSIYIASPDTSPEADYTLEVTCAAVPQLTDHTMAQNVDWPGTGNPIGRTSTFGSADEGAFSWVAVGPITGWHHVIWSFNEPDGTPYTSADVGIGGTLNFPGYKAWVEMYLIHQPAGLLPGLWTVDVTLDGQPLVTEHFTLVLQSMRPQIAPLTVRPIEPVGGR